MPPADFSYLLPLMRLAHELLGDEPDDPESPSTFGVGRPEVGSPLWLDDQDSGGFWPTMVLAAGINAALDHALTIHSVIAAPTRVTNSSMWGLLRGVIEPAATAVWVLDGKDRTNRRERAFRVWHHDLDQRAKWEDDAGARIAPGGQTAVARKRELLEVGAALELRPTQIVTTLNHSDMVMHAARAIGEDPVLARARWREMSGFAHGRIWPTFQLSSQDEATPHPDGLEASYTLAEDHHARAADLTQKVLERSVLQWGRLSAAT